MSQKRQKQDLDFEVDFYERVLEGDRRDRAVLELLSGLYARVGRVDDGLKTDRRLVRLDPDNAIAHYNLACSLAVKRRWKEALDALEKALEKGYNDLAWLVEDPDLKPLHRHPRFRKLLKAFPG
jgi:tetratricopeptide (TPR) repeat protein